MMVHPTAIVSPRAILKGDVEVGPYAVIGDGVRIGEGTRIGPHTVIEGRTEIGSSCQIGPHVVIGAPPQDVKYAGEETAVQIGEGTIIREFATIHRGTAKGRGITRIGPRCFLMVSAHVAHDCCVGEGVVLTNLATLGGHVEVGSFSVIGGLAGIHQFVRIGRYVMVSGLSGVNQDIPPFIMVQGVPAHPIGLNTVGLRRKKFSPAVLTRLKQTYRILFSSNLNTSQALERIGEEVEACPEVDELVAFIRASERGIIK